MFLVRVNRRVRRVCICRARWPPTSNTYFQIGVAPYELVHNAPHRHKRTAQRLPADSHTFNRRVARAKGSDLCRARGTVLVNSHRMLLSPRFPTAKPTRLALPTKTSKTTPCKVASWVAGMDSYPRKHFDTSGKSAAQFHTCAIGVIVHGATVGLSARLQAAPIQIVHDLDQEPLVLLGFPTEPAAGLDGNVTPHTLRHTAATLAHGKRLVISACR
jgi:hypothetical protein